MSNVKPCNVKFRAFVGIAFLMFLSAVAVLTQSPNQGFIYWLTGIPGANSKDYSMTARITGRMYCTDSFNTWNFGTVGTNNTRCNNGARLINQVEWDGGLVEEAIDTYGESVDYVSQTFVLETDVPGAIWCETWAFPGFISPPTVSNYFENCTPGQCRPETSGADLTEIRTAEPTEPEQVNCAAPEYCNGVDDNEDGIVDEGFSDTDNDTYICDDCEPLISTIYPGAAETCDCQDGNCNGMEDEQSTCNQTHGFPQCSVGAWYWCMDGGSGGCCGDPFGCLPSPILIDVEGDGFSLTNKSNGVFFDIDGNGIPDRISWTKRTSDDSWLALDRNGNGTIDSGKELFGNLTSQPQPGTGDPEPNGFIALAEYDKASNGGNGDGKISSQDSIFTSLRLWRDSNHDGVSQNNEFSTLASHGLKKMKLDYKVSNKMDNHGNQFRWRAKVTGDDESSVGRWAWDVILLR